MDPVAITTLRKPCFKERGFVFSEVLKAQAFINEGKYKVTRQRLMWFFNCNIELKGKPQVFLPIGRQACRNHE